MIDIYSETTMKNKEILNTQLGLEIKFEDKGDIFSQ